MNTVRRVNRDAALIRAAADVLAQLSTTYKVDPFHWVGVHPRNTELYKLADELDGGKA